MRRVPFLVSAVLFAIFATLFVYASLAPKPSSVAGPLDPVRHLAAEEAKIRETLIDPESAKFRNDFVSRKDGPPVVCGEINYKNTLGGYVGFQKFIWGEGIRLFGIDTQADVMATHWQDRCVRP
jgi:hypothetical protein